MIRLEKLMDMAKGLNVTHLNLHKTEKTEIEIKKILIYLNKRQ